MHMRICAVHVHVLVISVHVNVHAKVTIRCWQTISLYRDSAFD